MNGTQVMLVVMRYIHLVSVICTVGGLAFISFCLRPGLRVVEEGFRQAMLRTIDHAFQRVLLVGIVGLIVSGVYNWVSFAPTYRVLTWHVAGLTLPLGQMLIGTKVLLALVIFAVAFGRAFGFLKDARFWHTFMLHLAATVILLAVILHQVRMEHCRLLAAAAGH